jgi:hypothetical protein
LDVAREAGSAVSASEVLDARRGVADDLQVDAGGVHGGQPPLAEIVEVGAERDWDAVVSGCAAAPIAVATPGSRSALPRR